MRDYPLLAYFGHHKCATQWIKGLLWQLCRDLDLNFHTTPNAKLFQNDVWTFVRQHDVHVLACTNATPTCCDALRKGPHRGFHVIRDPRDILVSAYFSHLNSHPTDTWPALTEHREKLRSVSQEAGLMMEMDFLSGVFQAMERWDYDQPDILELKMESLIQSPYETMAEALKHLDVLDEGFSLKTRLSFLGAQALRRFKLDFPASSLLRVTGQRMPVEVMLGHLYRNRYSVMAGGRKRGEEDAANHYRKGVAGDWKNHFTPALEDAFHSRYQRLLQRTGYDLIEKH